MATHGDSEIEVNTPGDKQALYETIEGVPIKLDGRKGHREEWRSVFETWLPRFRERGWLEDLNEIVVGSDMLTIQNEHGRYQHDAQQIYLIPDISTMQGPPWCVGATRDYLLVHEMIHHAHMTSILSLKSLRTKSDDALEFELATSEYNTAFNQISEKKLENRVSEYAAYNFLEAVAEIGSLELVYKSADKGILSIYDALGGPPLRNA